MMFYWIFIILIGRFSFGHNISQSVYPLRVPPDVKEFYVHKTKDHYTRPKRSNGPNSRNGRQLEPGVYSCGHQGSDMFLNFINPRYIEIEM